MGLDSYEFPVKSFGDLGFRLYGRWMRHFFNILQAIQLILNVGTIIISNGEALSQAAKFKLCFAVCCLVWALAGFIFGQVRTLQRFAWLANCAVWINIIVIGITMGAAATTPPNYLAVNSSAGAGINDGISITPDPTTGAFPGVQHFGNLPDTSNFVGSLNGAMSAVFSYGGSMIFPEFMSEMRRPKDFLKVWAGCSPYLTPAWLTVHKYRGCGALSSSSTLYTCSTVFSCMAIKANMSSIQATSVSPSTISKPLETFSLWLARS